MKATIVCTFGYKSEGLHTIPDAKVQIFEEG